MRRPLLLVAICLVSVMGFLLHLGIFDRVPEGQVGAEALTAGELLTFTGQVYQKDSEKLYFRSVHIISLAEDSQPAIPCKDNFICIPEQGTDIPLGSVMMVRGTFQSFSTATNPGEFDSRGYYRTLGIGGRVKDAVVLAQGESCWRLREALYQVRSLLRQRLENVFPEKEAAVMCALLLGDKEDLDPELKELYQRNGILHILSISSLHITMIGMSVYQLLRRCRMPVCPAAAGGCCLLILYGMMTGFSVSACRAIGMYLLRMIAEMVGRTYDMPTAMGVTAAVLVVKNPYYLQHTGFLLSFASMIGIGVVYPAMGEGGRKKTVKERLLEPVLSGTSITLATLPVQLWFYYQVPSYSVLLNVLVLPFMKILMAAGFLTLIPGLGICGWADRLILRGYEILCGVFDRFPFHTWNPGKPRLWQVIAYYLILAAVVWGRKYLMEKGRNQQEKRRKTLKEKTGGSLEKELGKTLWKEPGKKPRKTSGKEPGKTMGEEPGKTMGKGLGEKPRKTSGKEPGKTMGEEPGKTMGKKPGKTMGKEPRKTLGKEPGKTMGKESRKTSGEEPGKRLGRIIEKNQEKSQREDQMEKSQRSWSKSQKKRKTQRLHTCRDSWRERLKMRKEKAAGICNDKMYGIGAAACLVVLLLSPIIFAWRPPAENHLLFLDVGQGDGILVRTASGENYLFDGGSSSRSHVGKYVLLPCLRYYGIQTLDAVILSHPDADHVNGAMELISMGQDSGIKIKQLVLPELSEEGKAEMLGQLGKFVEQEDWSGKIPIGFLSAGETFRCDRAEFLCLHPESGWKETEPNVYSICIYGIFTDKKGKKEFDFLMTGDVEGRGEEALLAESRGRNIQGVAVLKVAHHGSKNSSSQYFLEQADPVLSVISCGRNNRYGHPHQELLERLEDTGCAIVTTSEMGAVRVSAEQGMIRVETFYSREQ